MPWPNVQNRQAFRIGRQGGGSAPLGPVSPRRGMVTSGLRLPGAATGRLQNGWRGIMDHSRSGGRVRSRGDDAACGYLSRQGRGTVSLDAQVLQELKRKDGA